jgi:hypothetical protein
MTEKFTLIYAQQNVVNKVAPKKHKTSDHKD